MNQVELEFSWTGGYTTPTGGKIRAIDIKIRDFLASVEAYIDTTSPTQKQELQIKCGGEVGSCFTCSHEAAKTMELSARVFEHHEDKFQRAELENGQVTGNLRPVRIDKPISIQSRRNFQGGKSYRITVIHESGKFKACICEIMKMTEEQLRFGMEWICSVDRDIIVREKDPVLDCMEVPALQAKLAVAKENKKEAQLAYEEALKSSDLLLISNTLREKQKAFQNMQRLKRALQRKGVFNGS